MEKENDKHYSLTNNELNTINTSNNRIFVGYFNPTTATLSSSIFILHIFQIKNRKKWNIYWII